MREIIFDSCVLSNFALSDSHYLIEKQYAGACYITDFVGAEITQGILKGYSGLIRIKEALKEGWLKEIALEGFKEKALFESLLLSLGSGEASCIAAAKTREYIFACDDRAARREAGLLGVKLTGTIGILLKNVKSKDISAKKADEILTLMVRQGFYSPIASIRELL